MSSKLSENPIEITLPDKFSEFIEDFLKDLTTTFPEYSDKWKRWENSTEENLIILFQYFLTVFPERFFDIIYQNTEIFLPESVINTVFLPDMDFKILYNSENVSDITKKTIWKYLQLILFSTVNSVKDKNGFGDAMNMFEGVNEKELQEKLHETMKGVEAFFKTMDGTMDNESDTKSDNQDTKDESKKTSFDFKDMNMPNPEQMHEHLRGLFDGKIGKLAKEMAEEISNDLGGLGLGGADNASPETAQEMLKNLMKNPEKMMGIVKKVGDKLNDKMKTGEITQEEIMREAGDLMNKMKDMSGGKDIGEMMKKMVRQMGAGMMGGGAAGGGGMPDAEQLAKMMARMGKGAKVDTNAMNTMIKKQTLKDKMKVRIENKRQQAIAQAASNAIADAKLKSSAYLDGNVFKIVGETQQKSSIQSLSSSDDIDKIIENLGFDTVDDTKSSTQLPKKNKKKKGKK